MFGGMGQSAVKNLGNGGTMDGDVTITGDLTVNGGIGLSLSEVIQGTSTIDITNTEAFLVRKNGDGGDIFVVDTTNSRIGIGGTPDKALTISSANAQLHIKESDAGTNLKNWLFNAEGGVLYYQTLTDAIGGGSTYMQVNRTEATTTSVSFPTGNISIGHTNPEASLDVNTNITAGGGVAYGTIIRGSESADGDNLDTGDGIGLKFEIPIDTATSNIGASIEAVKSSHLDSNSETKMILKTSGNDETLDTAFTIFSNQNTAIEATKGFYLDGGGNTFISEVSADTIQFTTGGSERVRIDSSGKVGIGTSANVDAKLHIEETASSTDVAVKLEATNDVYLQLAPANTVKWAITADYPSTDDFNVYNYPNNRNDFTITGATGKITTSSSMAVGGTLGVGGSQSTALHVINTNPIFRLQNGGNYFDYAHTSGNDLDISYNGGSSLLHLQNNGNVGIGTTSPSSYETSADNFVVAGSGNEGITIATGTTHTGSIHFADGTSGVDSYRGYINYSHDQNSLRFGTDGSERMRIASDGKIGIGTTTSGASLEIAGDGTSANLLRLRHSGSGTNGVLDLSATSTIANIVANYSSSAIPLRFLTGAAERMRITETGTITFVQNDSNLHILDAGTNAIQIKSDAGDEIYFGSNNTFQLRFLGDGTAVEVNSGVDFIPNADSTSSLGTTSKRWSNLFTDSITVGGTLTAGGNIEILKGTPTLTLKQSDTSSNQIEMKNSGGSIVGRIKYDTAGGNHMYIENRNAGNLVLETSDVARMILDDNSRISLSNNDSGTQNTVFGHSAGANIDAGTNYNVFIGHNVAGATLDNATENTGVGYSALANLTSADHNTAIGRSAGLNINTGSNNTIVGAEAGDAMTNNAGNVIVGKSAFSAANSGENYNVVLGSDAGTAIDNADADYNILIGQDAGTGGSGAMAKCIAIGGNAMNSTATNAQTGTIAIGHDSLTNLTTGTGNVSIGYHSAKAMTVGSSNVAIGNNALSEEVGGGGNVAIGTDCMVKQDGGDSASSRNNVGVGANAGYYNVTGQYNVYVGSSAGLGASGQSNSGNTGLGYQALTSVSTGGYNVAIGNEAGESVTTGGSNILIGSLSGDGISNASHIVAIGDSTVRLGTVTTGANGSVAVGSYSLGALTSGAGNTAVGYASMQNGGTINTSTAIGYATLQNSVDGMTGNTAIGYGVLDSANNSNADDNTGVGKEALGILSSGAQNVAVGKDAGNVIQAGNNNVCIGKGANPSASGGANQIVLGKDATGLADNSVTLGNADVTAVYMASDSGAKVHCSAIIHTQENVTIASDAITVTSSYVRVLTEGSTSSDELATINGGSAGQVLYLHQQLSTKDITLKDGTGNLALAGDFAMDHAQDMIHLIYSAADSVWIEVSRSSNA